MMTIFHFYGKDSPAYLFLNLRFLNFLCCGTVTLIGKYLINAIQAKFLENRKFQHRLFKI